MMKKGTVEMVVSSPDVMVTDASGIPVNCQVDLVWNPELDLSRYKVLFTAEVPAVGFATYQLKKFVCLVVLLLHLIDNYNRFSFVLK